jgi:hypothetical protein
VTTSAGAQHHTLHPNALGRAASLNRPPVLFCSRRYCPNYDSLDCAFPWAKESLLLHAKDKREYVYSYQQLEQAKTHDALWNAAQRQMVLEGKMHGFLRMYWAKKILEWTASPQEALAFGIKLNDRWRRARSTRRPACPHSTAPRAGFPWTAATPTATRALRGPSPASTTWAGLSGRCSARSAT